MAMFSFKNACFLIWVLVYVDWINGTRHYSNSNRSTLIAVHPKKSVYWRPNTEGFYSHFIQLKLLVYARKLSKSNRVIMIEDFHSRHYANTLADTRLCNFLHLPEYIQCVPYRATDEHIHCTRDMRILFSPNNHVCYNGYPYWANTKKLTGKIRHEVATLMPRLTFKSKFIALAEKVKASLGLMGDFVAIQWRRGDQISVRCNRNVSPDDSLNCGTGMDFINYLQNSVKKTYPKMPIILVTNENDKTILDSVKHIGIIVVNEEVVMKLLNASYSNITALRPSFSSNHSHVLHHLNHTMIGGNDVHVHQRKLAANLNSKQRLLQPNEKSLTISKSGSVSDRNAKVESKSIKTEDVGNFKYDKPQNAKFLPAARIEDKRTPAVKKEASALATAQLTQLAIESILLLDAKFFLTFGISTFHDAIEAERMLRRKSYCIEPQGVMSFCHALTSPQSVSLNSTIFPIFSKSSIEEFIKDSNPPEGTIPRF